MTTQTSTITSQLATIKLADTTSTISKPAHPKIPELPERFKLLKREIIKPENEEKLKASYQRLLKALEAKSDEIAAEGASYIPEVSWSDIKDNNYIIPHKISQKFEERGCIIVKGVVDREVANEWYGSLHDFVKKNPKIGGNPSSAPTIWNGYWIKGQVQARSHPEIMKCMTTIGQIWNSKPETLIDMDSQIVYPDRFRIRYPGKSYSLKLHLDSGAVERWEDEAYRNVYRSILEGDWENYDPYCLDDRPFAKSDLYSSLAERPSACSAFRSLQGWLSLSDTKGGEGTIRLLPDIKLTTAYMMLRPFFWKDDGEIDFETSHFPGATPGSGQYFPNEKWYPHLYHEKTVVPITQVEPGDYVFWHCDLAHEVDSNHVGNTHSSVFYHAQVPLCPYNIENMINTRKAFEDVVPPVDFNHKVGSDTIFERDCEDHGARLENILSDDGLRALGLKEFDAEEEGITKGQREIRIMANEAIAKSFG